MNSNRETVKQGDGEWYTQGHKDSSPLVASVDGRMKALGRKNFEGEVPKKFNLIEPPTVEVDNDDYEIG